jgi:alpha-L-fucosidase
MKTKPERSFRQAWTMRFYHLLVCCAFGLAVFGPTVRAQSAPSLTELPELGSTEGPVKSRRAWNDAQKSYDAARFGMFLHWGLYSQAGGEWRGTRFYGISEWIAYHLRIPMREYAALADEFNPSAFDAQEWVRIAKESGVRYIVITAKHHDGFAMFDSRVSDFNIVAATPFKRDPLKELTTAARAAGIKIGFYYSQTQDWHEPDAVGNTWDFAAQGRDFSKYYTGKAIPQVKELLTRYGPIDLIWFDTPTNISTADAKALYDLVKQLQPNCLVSSRLGGGLGDFQVFGDAELPTRGSASLPWEAIFTHNDSWGYRSFDSNFKSTDELLALLVRAASRGGNLLVNIGPDGKGRFPPTSVARFQELGKWLKRNGESIYGTSASPLGPVPWGYITQRPGKLYLHILTPPDDGRIWVPGLDAKITSVRYLVGQKQLSYRRLDTDLWIDATDRPDRRDSVAVIDYAGPLKPSVARGLLVARNYPRTIISPPQANETPGIKQAMFTHSFYFGEWHHIETLTGLTSPEVSAEWSLYVPDPGDYRITLHYAASGKQAGREGWIEGGGASFRFQVLQTTDGYSTTRPAPIVAHDVGLLRFDRAGEYRLRLRPASAGPDMFLLQDIVLTPND